jgi:glucan biosynthesis protein C
VPGPLLFSKSEGCTVSLDIVASIHPLILVAVGYTLSGTTAPPFIKLALAATLALSLCFGAAALIRRLPFDRRIL